MRVQPFDLRDHGDQQRRQIFMHGAPDIGFFYIIVLVPVKIAGIADIAPRQMGAPIAHIVMETPACLRNDLDSAHDGVAAFDVGGKTLKIVAACKLLSEKNIIAHVEQSVAA